MAWLLVSNKIIRRHLERFINNKAAATEQHKTPDQIVNFTQDFTDQSFQI